MPHRAEAHTTVLSKPVGQRLRACPDAMCILRGLAARENGPKVWKSNQARVVRDDAGAKNFLGETRPGIPPSLTTRQQITGAKLLTFAPIGAARETRLAPRHSRNALGRDHLFGALGDSAL